MAHTEDQYDWKRKWICVDLGKYYYLDRPSGRALSTLVIRDGRSFGHITTIFTGVYWQSLSQQVQLGALQKLVTFDKRKFTITNVRRGNKSLHFKSAELEQIRLEMASYFIGCGIGDPINMRNGEGTDDFHCEITKQDEPAAGLVEGAVFEFTPASGYSMADIASE